MATGKPVAIILEYFPKNKTTITYLKIPIMPASKIDAEPSVNSAPKVST